VPLKDENELLPAAACLVFDGDGRRVGRYDKIHLFDVAVPASTESYRESVATRPGRKPLLVDTPCGRLGITVCYDLRFPELYRELQAQGADGFAVPAAFTARTGRAHWDILVRARAIENLSFVLAAAQSGDHPGARQTYGHSMIVDAWGQVLGRLQQEDEGVVLANLDAQAQMLLRQQFPALRHSRRWLDGPQTNEQEET
jgi:nitrilase